MPECYELRFAPQVRGLGLSGLMFSFHRFIRFCAAQIAGNGQGLACFPRSSNIPKLRKIS